MAGNYGNNREKPDNSGALFKNNRRENDKQPEYTGQATINGVEMWVSAWIKESKKDGSKFFSLAFQPKEDRRQGGGDRRPGNDQGGGNFRPQQQSRGGEARGGDDSRWAKKATGEDDVPF